MAQLPGLFASVTYRMRYGSGHHGSLGRLLGNIFVAALLGWACLSFGAWIGWTSPPGCYVGQGMVALTSSQLLGTLATICVIVWAATLFTWHQALIWAVLIMFGAAWAASEAPALLATC